MPRFLTLCRIFLSGTVAFGCGEAATDDLGQNDLGAGAAGNTLLSSGGSAIGTGAAASTDASDGVTGDSEPMGMPQGGSEIDSHDEIETCTPVCADRVCGPDPICGEACGACNAGLECVAGECRAPVPLRENGDTCSTNGECASANCGLSSVGESRCYGSSARNEICGNTFDCSAGSCLEPIPGSGTGACVPGINVCYSEDVSAPCTEYAVVFCQLIQLCDTNVSSSISDELFDFDYCIGSECTYANDGVSDMTPTECTQAVAAVRGGTLGCP